MILFRVARSYSWNRCRRPHDHSASFAHLAAIGIGGCDLNAGLRLAPGCTDKPISRWVARVGISSFLVGLVNLHMGMRFAQSYLGNAATSVMRLVS
jgi:hypothetical protein